MSDYLIRQANLEDIITQTEVPNLEIITSGNVPPNPVELLTSDRMKDHFQSYKKFETEKGSMLLDQAFSKLFGEVK